jgi:hypothetical protein
VLLVALLVAAFSLVLLQAGASNRLGIGQHSSPPEATPSEQAMATATIPLAPPTPTHEPPGGGGPVHTPSGADPFTVTSLDIDYVGASPGYEFLDAQGAYTGRCLQPTFAYEIRGHPFVPREAVGGSITYRLHIDDTVTESRVARYTWDNQYDENILKYVLKIDTAHADGTPITVRLELLSPVSMISRPLTFSITCLTQFQYGRADVRAPGNPPNTDYPDWYYDCNGPDVQTFTYDGRVFASVGTGLTLTYYWVHPNGSTTTSAQVTIAPGALSAAVAPDSFTLARDAPKTGPGRDYSSTLVVMAPYALSFAAQTVVYKFC